MSKSILIIDGNNLFGRMFFIPDNTRDLCVNKVRSLLRSPVNFDQCFFVVDSFEKRSFRYDLYPEYKGERKEKPEEYYEILELVKDSIKTFPKIKLVEDENYEADDLIASIAEASDKKSNYSNKNYIYSNDKDFYQLLSDTVFILTDKGVYTREDFEKDFGFSSCLFIDYLAMVGDRSDNILGIYRLGKVGATKILKEFGELENAIKKYKETGNKFFITYVENDLTKLNLWKQLVTLKKDIFSK